ncbi:hypothetical protein DAETH_48600 (plasmid) [Deinococcus aetherius]|uniref:Uncharacterized protein n=1 Tax=Deinococcus aetherius TaxID=200252 RepID=A0ABN6RSD7_9DEIO|nr:hypothetical protein [Deinococcus aetherius]BDP44891.1 hypothetical protein DAETH_48600 [Deinococcus aetherius]
MTTLDLEVAFGLELPEAYRYFIERFGVRATGGLSNALVMLYGLPYGTPAALRIRYTDRFRLLEVGGPVKRTPSQAEIQGLLTGAVTALLTVLTEDSLQVDLNPRRVTDA